MTIRIVVIEQDPHTRQRIREVLAELVDVELLADTESLVYGYELVRNNQPDLALVGLDPNPNRALETCERITTHLKLTTVVGITQVQDLQMTQACMRAGVREILQRPVAEDPLKAVVENYERTWGRGGRGARGGVEGAQSGDSDPSGRILTVFSNKGGIGKTAIASNLAISLSEVTQKPVALVDLNLQLGDITTFMNVKPKQTIVDLAKNIARVDAAYLENSLAQYRQGNSQVYILADPLNLEESEEITPEQINAVLTVLKALFDYVVVDAASTFDARTLVSLDLADTVFLVSTINLPCIRSSQRALNIFRRLDYDDEKVKLVINRYLPTDEITIEDVEDTLDHPIFWKLPNDYSALMNSINRGEPLNTFEKGKVMYQNFIKLARQVTGLFGEHSVAHNGETKQSGLLAGLFKR